ncbi:sensor histidine kinase [Desulfocicer niacini]
MQGGDGALHDVLLSKATYTDGKENVVGLIGAMLDITLSKEMEKRLQHSQKMEAIGTLAGGIAHDFNNILSSILGFSELALDAVETGSDLEDDLQEIYVAGKRAKDLVRQILTFARQSDDAFKPIQIRSLAGEVLKFIRASLPATIKIKQRIQGDAYVLGSPSQMHQVLMNLCTNAADAMADKGGFLCLDMVERHQNKTPLISGLTLEPGDYIEIKLTDTGVGIDPDILGSIFDPYFTTKPPGEGTGLGLAVVHGVVQAHGGKICVESTPGKGTTFTVFLPITQQKKDHQGYVPEPLPTGSKIQCLFRGGAFYAD